MDQIPHTIWGLLIQNLIVFLSKNQKFIDKVVNKYNSSKKFCYWASKQPLSNKNLFIKNTMVDNIERIDLSQEIALVQKRVPQEGSIPSPRSSALAVLLTSGKIWMLGGNSNENEFSDLYELDLQTLKWKKLYGDWKTKWTGSAGIVMKTGLSEKDIIIQYGGFCGDSYSDSLYLLECNSLTIKEAKRDEQHGKLKTMDMKKRIENDKLQPNSRRDHTMTYIQEPSCIIMIGGWNSIEWSPDDIRLDFWVLDSSNSFLV